MHDAVNDQLSEYLDDELSASERAAVEAHLASCPRCRVDLEQLRQVAVRARTLPDRPPAADLWPGVAARLEAPDAGKDRPRRFSFTMPQLVAAGLALMVLSGSMVWLARVGGPQTDFPPVSAETAEPISVNFADGAYDDAIADLQQTLEAGSTRLDQETVRILKENLETIDRAISQCRDALEDDPANVYLKTYLASARAKKLDILRQATAIVDRSS